jgi:hypothetical protein
MRPRSLDKVVQGDEPFPLWIAVLAVVCVILWIVIRALRAERRRERQEREAPRPD